MKKQYYRLVLGIMFLVIGFCMLAAGDESSRYVTRLIVGFFFCVSHWSYCRDFKALESKPKETGGKVKDLDDIPKEQAAATSQKASVSTVKEMQSYPSVVDGCEIKYCYVIKFVPQDGVDIEKDILGDAEKIVDVDSDGKRVILLYNGNVFGKISDEGKAKMVQDFKKRGEPCNAILLADGDKVNLRFYKDKLKSLARYDSDVVQLRNFKSEKKQEIIEFLESNTELDFEDTDEKITVEYFGDSIGRLPSSVEKRVNEEDEEIHIILFDHIEEAETEFGEIIYVPYVRVYWE